MFLNITYPKRNPTMGHNLNKSKYYIFQKHNLISHQAQLL